MKSLKLCHDNYPWLKFAGACNTEKHNLNLCLRGEVRSPSPQSSLGDEQSCRGIRSCPSFTR